MNKWGRSVVVYLNQRWKALLFRIFVSNIVFFGVKFTTDHDNSIMEGYHVGTALFYYFSSLFLFLSCWEINDYYLRRQNVRGEELSARSSFRIVAKTMFWVVLFSVGIYYTGLFPLREFFGIVSELSYSAQFGTDVFRAIILGLAVTFFNMFYFALRQKDELQRQMKELRQEMVASQYASLKSQISPHFLFNSLNTLTSLMYEDRDLASDFVTRLASSYRYILINRESDLVSLDSELKFLDNYSFMMEVRHGGAVHISTAISLDPGSVFLPTLSIQMLVENALKHNYYSRQQPLTIEIRTNGQDLLEVINNLNPRKEEADSTGVGLDNIRKRYAVYTRRAVQIFRDEDEFRVQIPLLSRENDSIRFLLNKLETHVDEGDHY